jgi:hypothetical protein
MRRTEQYVTERSATKLMIATLVQVFNSELGRFI